MRTIIPVPYCCFIVLMACGSRTEAPRKAAADLEGSAAAGMSYSYIDFSQKLQALGSAISLARRDGASESALRPYQEAFDTYMDGMDLWKLKIACPAEFMEGGTDCSIVESKMEEFASKYNVPYEGSNLNRAWLHKNANVPFGRRELYPTWDVRRANTDVFPKLLGTIWDKANQKSKEP